MTTTFLIDPLEVLGVTTDSTLAEIQAAYRAKSKKLHPDMGGDAWAFRVLNRCYEQLSTARVLGRATEEFRRSPVSTPPNEQRSENRAGAAPGAAETRLGVHEVDYPPLRQIAVEMLLIRFELDASLGLLMASDEDRNLSCTLNVRWPAQSDPPPPGPDTTAALRALADIFKLVVRKSRPRSSWSETREGRFSGWLTFASALQADQAFQLLHPEANRRQFGIVQTIRDVAIPRDWHGS